MAVSPPRLTSMGLTLHSEGQTHARKLGQACQARNCAPTRRDVGAYEHGSASRSEGKPMAASPPRLTSMGLSLHLEGQTHTRRPGLACQAWTPHRNSWKFRVGGPSLRARPTGLPLGTPSRSEGELTSMGLTIRRVKPTLLSQGRLARNDVTWELTNMGLPPELRANPWS